MIFFSFCTSICSNCTQTMLNKAAALSTNEGLARDGTESHWEDNEACTQHKQGLSFNNSSLHTYPGGETSQHIAPAMATAISRKVEASLVCAGHNKAFQ